MQPYTFMLKMVGDSEKDMRVHQIRLLMAAQEKGVCHGCLEIVVVSLNILLLLIYSRICQI